MRAVIERVTCDNCGQVFDFEKLTNDGRMRARYEALTDWLIGLGWQCRPFENSSFRTMDHCPGCMKDRQ